MKGVLVLEDGTTFEGISIGSSEEKIGEIVLNTAVVGYQELMTDPANADKILTLTYPLIGNYGVAKKFNESSRPWIKGLIIKEESRITSNWESEDSLQNFIQQNSIPALSQIDTRTLAIKIQNQGSLFGMISTNSNNKNDLRQKILNYKNNYKKDIIKNISVKQITKINNIPSGKKIAILDLGCLNSFINQLKLLKCSITLLPYETDAEKILSLKPQGLVISNGPENDKAIPLVVNTVKKLLGKIPMLGMALGHEILGLALEGKLKKLFMGHHGVNYPVRSPSSFKGEITVQNHDYIIDEDSIKKRKDIKIVLKNVNDDSIEEMESKPLKFISCQYYPVSPGPNEVNDVFKRFLKYSATKALRHKARGNRAQRSG